MKSIVIVGSGGHAKSCLDVVRATGHFKVLGLIAQRVELGGHEDYNPDVIGDDSGIEPLVNAGTSFLIGIGQIQNSEPRKRMFDNLVAAGADLPVIVAPTSSVSPEALVGSGTIVMHMARVGPNAHVGENCIINSRALVEHDVWLGSQCHVATGALVNGGCQIGDGSFVGSGAVLKQGIRIGRNVVIGMGAVVRHDVDDDQRVW